MQDLLEILGKALAFIALERPETHPFLMQEAWGVVYIRLTSERGKEARVYARGDGNGDWRYYPNRVPAGCLVLGTALDFALTDADENNPFGGPGVKGAPPLQ